MMIVSPIGGRLSGVVGSKVPLVLGSVDHDARVRRARVSASARWEIYLASALLGIGVGFAFASMANLIVEAVPPDQTGVATGMNTIVRTIGGAIGAEVAASHPRGQRARGRLPGKHGYTITFCDLRGRARRRRRRLARRPRPQAADLRAR